MRTSKVNNIKKAATRKHVPTRTCVACRQTSGKRELIRLVHSRDGVIVDARGREPGRGVYLCARRKCWETALKGKRIEFGLRTSLSAENRQSLVEYGTRLPERENM